MIFAQFYKVYDDGDGPILREVLGPLSTIDLPHNRAGIWKETCDDLAEAQGYDAYRVYMVNTANGYAGRPRQLTPIRWLGEAPELRHFTPTPTDLLPCTL